jgi:serine/threonine protein kinase
VETVLSVLERLLPNLGDRLLGRYQLQEEIGRGAFGVVYRASADNAYEDVAVKVLLPHVVDDDSIVDRFEREVRIASKLRHPNSIRIYQSGRTRQGLPFYVMEFLTGRPLDAVIYEAGRLSPERTRHIAIQVLQCLSEAHSHGFIHRDLKPSNIMLRRSGADADYVKVLDFGIAKALVGDQALRKTQAGLVLGTPAYMSHEQARADPDLDGRSDLYSLGLIIAECITGRAIVQGVTPYVVMAQQASKNPIKFNSLVKKSPLWKIIRTATQKTRDKRFPNADEMRFALENVSSLPEYVPPLLSVGHHPSQKSKPTVVASSPVTPVPGEFDRIGPTRPIQPQTPIPRRDPVAEHTVLASTAPSQPSGEVIPHPQGAASRDPQRDQKTVLHGAYSGEFAGRFRGDQPESQPTVLSPGGTGQTSPHPSAGYDSGRSPAADSGGPGQMVVSAFRHRAKTMVHPSRHEETTAPRRAVGPKWPFILMAGLGVATVAAIIAVVLVTRDTGERSDGAGPPGTAPPANHEADGSGTSPEAAVRAETERMLSALEQRENAREAIGLAREAVELGVPPLITMRFEGTEGAEVSVGDIPLGEIPFELVHPRLDARVVVQAERRRYRPETVSISLFDEVVTIELRRR